MKMTKHNQHVLDFMNRQSTTKKDRLNIEAYIDKFITDYNRACNQSGDVNKQV